MSRTHADRFNEMLNPGRPKVGQRPSLVTPEPAPLPAVDAGEGAQADDRPDLGGPYRAFAHPRSHTLQTLHLYFNAAERRRYGKKKMQVQYEHLDSDDPESEGMADDGQSFTFVVSGARKQLRIVVRGRRLEEGYDLLTFHRLQWMRSADSERDFGQGDEPVITGFQIEPITEEEGARA
jgi:hypothetical protein